MSRLDTGVDHVCAVDGCRCRRRLRRYEPRLPLDPILARVSHGARRAFADEIGGSRTIYDERGMTWRIGDRAAVRLGHHPTAVWGPLWWQICPEPEPEAAGRFCGRPGPSTGHRCAVDGCRCQLTRPALEVPA